MYLWHSVFANIHLIDNAYLISNTTCIEAVVVVIVVDLQLPMHSVPITTDVVSSNLDQGEVTQRGWFVPRVPVHPKYKY